MSGERLWDPYLTEVERTIYKDYRTTPQWGKQPAVLVIDVYNAVFGERPLPILDAVKHYPRSCGENAWNALPHIQRLLQAARETGVPVVYITAKIEPERVGDSQLTATLRTSPDRNPEWEYTIVDAIAPQPGDIVIRKSRASAFYGTTLASHLTTLGVDTLIVVGETTSGCVRASVVDAYSHGYKTVIAEEGVFDRSWVSHCINLFDMHHKYAPVLKTDEIIAYLRERHRAVAGGR